MVSTFSFIWRPPTVAIARTMPSDACAGGVSWNFSIFCSPVSVSAKSCVAGSTFHPAGIFSATVPLTAPAFEVTEASTACLLESVATIDFSINTTPTGGTITTGRFSSPYTWST